MFEQSVLEVRGLAARPWTLAASMTAQMALVSVAVLIPLVHPEVMQKVAVWIPVGPPPSYHPPAAQKVDVTRSVTRRLVPANAFVAPRSVPVRVQMIQDEIEVPVITGVQGGSGAGVPGGLDFTSATSQVIENIARTRPPVRETQAAVVKPASTPAVEQTKRVTVSTGVQAAMLMHGPKPEYPLLAKQARISGIVHLAAVIGADGRILDLRALDGHPLLVGAAIAAVKQWVYRPTLLNGEPVEVVTEITVTFTLQ
jgi:protein TonB